MYTKVTTGPQKWPKIRQTSITRSFLPEGQKKPAAEGRSLPLESKSKRFEELFGSVHVWTFFQKEGGGLPNSNLFEELFCMCLKIFQGGGHCCIVVHTNVIQQQIFSSIG